MGTTEINYIDAVILWVDGNDPRHREKTLPYLDNKKAINETKFRTRFDQVNEIKFSVNSILKFAPYIRNIFIVTDEQEPAFLKEENSSYDNVFIIDHKVIFKGYEKFLPTFCSLTIETCIHRIPGLSEHFIYLNDDFFIINKTEPSDFFRNGFPVLRGKWLKFDEDIFYKKFKKLGLGHKADQQRSAKLAGLDKYYNYKHTPHPLRKSTIEKYFEENPDVFLKNLQYKFRNNANYQFLPQGLSNYLEIKNKTCHFESNLNLIYFRSYKKSLGWYKLKFKKAKNKKLFMGLQSLDRCPKKILDFILNWLEECIL